jgi:hypothetical protein
MDTQSELLEAAKVALYQMCKVAADSYAFTDAVDRLDSAITKVDETPKHNEGPSEAEVLRFMQDYRDCIAPDEFTDVKHALTQFIKGRG